MRILFLVQIFETPEDTGSDRHYFFAKHLAGRGHCVHVLTSNIDYKNAVARFPGERRLFMRSVAGASVWYLPVFAGFRGSLFKRFVFFVSYFWRALFAIRRMPKFDVVYAVSTPLTVGVLGVLCSKIWRIPLVFEVTDLWPEAAIKTGAIKNSLVIFVARLAEQACYRLSRNIICLTKGIQKGVVEAGSEVARTTLITNGVDFSLFPERRRSSCAEVGLPSEFDGKFLAMYMGAHGLYNSLETIMGAASILKDNDQIRFVLIGAGDEKAAMVKFATDHGLTNVLFLGTTERQLSAALLSAADVFLLPNRRGSFYEGNLPNKLFDYLAVGRPIVVAGQGESANVVSDANAGICVDAEEAGQMAQAVMELWMLSAEERAAMGRNGREHVMQFFDRNVHAAQLEAVIVGANNSQRVGGDC